jgi:hypothetical protein
MNDAKEPTNGQAMVESPASLAAELPGLARLDEKSPASVAAGALSAPVAPAPAPADPPEVALLKAALKAELQSILDKPFTARMLSELGRAAQLSREFLMLKKDPRARRGQVGQTFPTPVGAYNSYGAGMGDLASDYGMEESDDMPSPITGTSSMMRAETFGATIMRELIAAMKDWQKPRPTVSDLVSGIASAKLSGLEDVVKTLEAELRQILGVPTLPEAKEAVAIGGAP